MTKANKITSIEQRGAVTSVYFDVRAGWSQWFLLRSDAHHDSIACARELEQAHLEEANKRGAYILDTGDLFDAMQGRFDPRRSMDELAPQYRRDDYYDFVVQDTAEFYAPYAKQFLLLGRGNHETAVRKNANTDLTDRLVYLLRSGHKSPVMAGGYGGWIRLMFNFSDGKNTGPRSSLKIKYFHGAGGEAPVTRGAIHTNRQAVYLPDADIVINGHNHHAYWIPISRERLSNKGKQYFDVQHYFRIPGYKQSYGNGTGGWEVIRGGVPKPIGAFWLKLSVQNTKDGSDYIAINHEDAIVGASAEVGETDGLEPTYGFYPDDPEGE